MLLPPWTLKILRNRKVRICAGVALSAAVLAGWLFYTGTNWAARREIEQQLARWHAAGIATDLDTYYRPVAAPDQDLFQDVAIQKEFRERIIEKSSSLTSKSSESYIPEARTVDLTTWVNPPAADKEEAARRWLASDQVAESRWRDLRTAFGKSGAAWPVKSPEDLNAIYRFISGLSRYGSRHALAEMVSGNLPEALSDTRALIGMQRLSSLSQPCLYSGIASTLLGYTVRNCIWEGIARGLWDDAALTILDRDLSSLDPQRAAILSLEGEMAFAESNLRISREMSSGPDWMKIWTSDSSRWLPRLRGIWYDFRPRGLAQLEAIRCYDDLMNVGLMKDGSRRTTFSPVDFSAYGSFVAKPDPEIEIVPKVGAPYSIGREKAWHGLFAAARIGLTGEANLALLRTGIAVERYRLKHGQIPATLEALVPDFLATVPQDPFSGKALSFRVKADGSPLIWSYGTNGVDDGGTAGSSEDSGDLIWITRPPAP